MSAGEDTGIFKLGECPRLACLNALSGLKYIDTLLQIFNNVAIIIV